MNTNQNFKRYEMKYILSETQFHHLMFYLPLHMEMDDYGVHTICNLYYDTSDYAMIRRSLDKPLYKEKLRLRSYGIPRRESTVFVELKKKFAGIVYKRRIPLPLQDAVNYLGLGIRPSEESQILHEIDHVRGRRLLKPAACISYQRMAYFCKEDPELRMTFDRNIVGRSTCLDLTSGSYGSPILPKGQVLLEVKIAGAMPVWLSHIFSTLKIGPASFSKYGSYYQNYLSVANREKGGVACA